MSYEVKMPQLGMNQDTAIILSWFKKEGDKIEKGDPLFEVETDKATMEVEAQTDGYLSNVDAEEGTEVPVGQLMALIVDDEKEVKKKQSHSDDSGIVQAEQIHEKIIEPESLKDEVPTPGPASITEDKSIQVHENFRTELGSKVLASPKAKVAANELGIDLLELRNSGGKEPFHFADIRRTPPNQSFSTLYMRVSSEAIDSLLLKVKDPRRELLFSKFASSAWNFIFDDRRVKIIIKDITGEQSLDVSDDKEETNASSTILTLIDLCDTKLIAYETGKSGLHLSISQIGGEFTLCFSFNESVLQFSDSVKFMSELGVRLEDPILQLI